MCTIKFVTDASLIEERFAGIQSGWEKRGTAFLCSALCAGDSHVEVASSHPSGVGERWIGGWGVKVFWRFESNDFRILLAAKLRSGGHHDNRCMKKGGGVTRFSDFFNLWTCGYHTTGGRCSWIREGLRSKHGCEATADSWKRKLLKNGGRVASIVYCLQK